MNAATIYVDVDATGSNNGASWTNAYTSLQSAISNASSGDEVWVAEGTYKPSAYPVGRTSTDTREYAFYLESGVNYYGGFDGTETSRSQRDYSTNLTTLSGDIGTANNSTDNCYHVLVFNNSHFNVERSYDGRTFEAVGEVAGNGNSQHQIDYSYTDASVSKVQNTVYYRLKQVDFDGAFEYSDIRVVRFDAVGNNMQLVAYPNPMNDELNVMLSLPSGEKYQLQITNLQGALVHQKNHVFSSGLHTLELSQWNSGVYIIEVISDCGSEHIKVMKN